MRNSIRLFFATIIIISLQYETNSQSTETESNHKESTLIKRYREVDLESFKPIQGIILADRLDVLESDFDNEYVYVEEIACNESGHETQKFLYRSEDKYQSRMTFH